MQRKGSRRRRQINDELSTKRDHIKIIIHQKMKAKQREKHFYGSFCSTCFARFYIRCRMLPMFTQKICVDVDGSNANSRG